MNYFKLQTSFKACVFSLILVFIFSLSACVRYQAPAPVYGEPTNPYAEQPVVKTHPLEAIDNNDNTSALPEAVKPTKPTFPTANPIFVQKPLSPAVVALMSEADRNTKAGELESAVAVIERALRIDPRNPILTYKLARVRLQQSEPRLAEDLAKKAALLAGHDKALKKKSWLLISEARKQQKNYHGAKEARLRAAKIR